MNQHEAERIAAALNIVRPDWPTASLLTLIRTKLIDRPRRDVLVALAWVASEPNTATPARVLEAGPWWRAAGVEGTIAPRPPRPLSACRTCGREYRPDPPCCDHPTQRVDVADTAAHVAAVRAAIARKADA